MTFSESCTPFSRHFRKFAGKSKSKDRILEGLHVPSNVSATMLR